MTRRVPITFTEAEYLRGRAQLARYAVARENAQNGVNTVGTYGENASAALILLIQAEWLVRIRAGVLFGGLSVAGAYNQPWALLNTTDIGDSLPLAKKCGPETEAMYRATCNVVHKLMNGAVRVQNAPTLPSLPPGGVEDMASLGVIPAFIWPLVLGALGVASIVGVTWWGVDKNEKQVKVDMQAAQLAAQLDQYQRALDDLYRRGAPPPPTPKPIQDLANEEKGMGWLGLAIGTLIGGGSVYGIVRGVRGARSRASGGALTTVSNPRRRAPITRRRRRPRRNPGAAAPKATATAKPAAKATKKRPPRRAKRTTRPTTPRKRAPKRIVKRARPARPAPKKKNPKRPRASSGQAAFVRSQKSKGRSEKQARSAWKLKQRAKGKRRGKARARR